MTILRCIKAVLLIVLITACSTTVVDEPSSVEITYSPVPTTLQTQQLDEENLQPTVTHPTSTPIVTATALVESFESTSRTLIVIDPLVDESMSAIDLDTFTVTHPEDPTADVALFASVGSMIFYFLEPRNGSQFVEIADQDEGVECTMHEDQFSQVFLAELSNNPICGVTNNNTIVKIEIGHREFTADSDSYAEITITHQKDDD